MIKPKFASWKPIEAALLLALALCLLSGGLSLNRQERLAGQVVRLHVLANSDTQEDQALKLLVRDAVLQETTALLEGVDSRQAESLTAQQVA